MQQTTEVAGFSAHCGIFRHGSVFARIPPSPGAETGYRVAATRVVFTYGVRDYSFSSSIVIGANGMNYTQLELGP